MLARVDPRWDPGLLKFLGMLRVTIGLSVLAAVYTRFH